MFLRVHTKKILAAGKTRLKLHKIEQNKLDCHAQLDIHLFYQAVTVLGQNESRDLFYNVK